MDEKLLSLNILWLFFIVLLPFSTSLVGSNFFDTAAIFTYSANTFFIALLQYFIWNYVLKKPEFLKPESINQSVKFTYNLFCRLDILNGLLTAGISLFSPAIAFVLLVAKLPMVIVVTLFYGKRITKLKTETSVRDKIHSFCDLIYFFRSGVIKAVD